MEEYTNTNGYKADGLQELIVIFNKAAEKLFPGCIVEHFYYGDCLDMITIRLGNGHYGHFNLSANRVSHNGYTCSCDEGVRFEMLTFNDDVYKGMLFEIANG